ncbi:MAG: hypothetical protein C0484_07005 [Rhodospirillum sp.]|nr:hypothetical protein [Rhodospirillum sp.]
MPGELHDLVTDVEQDVGVVADAALQLLAAIADQDVVADAALQQVLAVAAGHVVVALAADQRVVAVVADHLVVAVGAIQDVVEEVADEEVAAGIAGTVERAAGQLEKLDVSGQGGGEGGDDVVEGAFVGELGDDVAGLVDEIPVVAVAAAHFVGAGQTVQCIVISGAGEGVVGGSSGHDSHCALHSCTCGSQGDACTRRGCRAHRV